MIFENDKKNEKKIIEKDSFYHEKTNILNNNAEDNKYISNYIFKHSQKLSNNNFYNFIKDESYKNIKNNIIKNKIFFFSSFINSCKSYNDISELRKDIETLNNQIVDEDEDEDYYYNIIYNYLKNVLELVSEKNFCEEEKNYDELLLIINKIDECLRINNNNNYYDIKNEIIIIEERIIKLLRKNNIKSKFIEKIINNTKKMLVQNIKNKNTINISDEKEYIENNNKIKKNNEYIDLKKNANNFIIKKDKKENEIPIYSEIYNKNKIISNFDNINWHNNINNNNNKNDDFSSINKDNKEFIKSNYDNNQIYNNLVLNKVKNNEKYSIFRNGIDSPKKSKIKENKKHKINKEEKRDNIPNSFNYENIMCPPIKSDID